jgi:hypothetical protein
MQILAALWQPPRSIDQLSTSLALVNDLLPGLISLHHELVKDGGFGTEIDHRLPPSGTMSARSEPVAGNRQEMRIFMHQGLSDLFFGFKDDGGKGDAADPVVRHTGRHAKALPSQFGLITEGELGRQLAKKISGKRVEAQNFGIPITPSEPISPLM